MHQPCHLFILSKTHNVPLPWPTFTHDKVLVCFKGFRYVTIILLRAHDINRIKNPVYLNSFVVDYSLAGNFLCV